MSLNMEQIAAAFCSHRFTETFPYMADEIKWNMIGREELIGREAVIDHCHKSVKFLETVTSTITKLKTYRLENCVILEGAAEFTDQENQTSGVASCDLFQFSDGRLVEITSYVIDLP
jgi:hypothetical protein